MAWGYGSRKAPITRALQIPEHVVGASHTLDRNPVPDGECLRLMLEHGGASLSSSSDLCEFEASPGQPGLRRETLDLTKKNRAERK